MKWFAIVGVLAVISLTTQALSSNRPPPVKEPFVPIGTEVTCEYWDKHVKSWLMCGTAGGRMALRPENFCRSAVKGLKWYRHHYTRWLTQADRVVQVKFQKAKSCPNARHLAKRWQHKARDARRYYARWYQYHYAWRDWLPSVWYGIGSCETGFGGDPNWHHNSGNSSGTSGYQGAFGFDHDSWDDFRPPGYPSEAFNATPRQQLIVAQLIEARYGLDQPWGCYP